MSNINDLPTEILLEIAEHLEHPVLYKGNALAYTCMPMWQTLGGKEVYRRAAVADRDRTRRADLICQAMVDGIIGWGKTEEQREDLNWSIEVARRGEGPTDKIEIAWAFEAGIGIVDSFRERYPVTDQAKSRCKLNSMTGKTFLNRAIVRCGDIAQIEDIIDTYVEVYRPVFAGACCGPLLELAPPYVDSFFTDGEVKVAWYGEYRRFQASPFNVALSKGDEETCLALLGCGADGPIATLAQDADADAIEE